MESNEGPGPRDTHISYLRDRRQQVVSAGGEVMMYVEAACGQA